MDLITDLAKANNFLQKYKADYAQIHMFSLSLRRLAIKIWRKDSTEVVYVILIGCKYILGNFDFQKPLLILSTENDKIGGTITKLIDKNSDFILIGNGGFVIAIGNLSFVESFDEIIESE